MDNVDYTYMWQNSCHAVARSMYVMPCQAGRAWVLWLRRPHSVKNATGSGITVHKRPTLEIRDDLQLFLTTFKLTTAINFNVHSTTQEAQCRPRQVPGLKNQINAVGLHRRLRTECRRWSLMMG